MWPHTHTCGHTHTNFPPNGVVWMTCKSRHNFSLVEKECCSCWQTLACSPSLSLTLMPGRKFFNFQSALHTLCLQLSPALFYCHWKHIEPPLVAPVIWPKHPLFLHSSRSVTFHFQCFSFFSLPSLRSLLKLELLSLQSILFV